MPDVWVVTFDYGYEGDRLSAVAASREEAKAWFPPSIQWTDYEFTSHGSLMYEGSPFAAEAVVLTRMRIGDASDIEARRIP